MSDTRIVSLTATGPDGIVVEIQLSGPADCPANGLRGRLDAAVRHVLAVFECGVPVEVSVGGTWMSGRLIG